MPPLVDFDFLNIFSNDWLSKSALVPLDNLLLVTREFIDETSIHLSRLLIRHGISNLNQLTGRQEGEDTGKAPRKS